MSPVRMRVWSIRPSDDNIRIMSCSDGISIENTSTAPGESVINA